MPSKKSSPQILVVSTSIGFGNQIERALGRKANVTLIHKPESIAKIATRDLENVIGVIIPTFSIDTEQSSYGKRRRANRPPKHPRRGRDGRLIESTERETPRICVDHKSLALALCKRKITEAEHLLIIGIGRRKEWSGDEEWEAACGQLETCKSPVQAAKRLLVLIDERKRAVEEAA